MLQALKLTMMALAYPQVALKAAKEGLTHEAFLYELARLECQECTQRRIHRYLQRLCTKSSACTKCRESAQNV